MTKYESQRSEVYEFMQNNPSVSRTQVIKNFAATGLNERTVRRWVKQIEDTGTLDRKLASGRPVSIATTSSLKRLQKTFSKQTEEHSQHNKVRGQSNINKMLKQPANKKKKQPKAKAIIKISTKLTNKKTK